MSGMYSALPHLSLCSKRVKLFHPNFIYGKKIFLENFSQKNISMNNSKHPVSLFSCEFVS